MAFDDRYVDVEGTPQDMILGTGELAVPLSAIKLAMGDSGGGTPDPMIQEIKTDTTAIKTDTTTLKTDTSTIKTEINNLKLSVSNGKNSVKTAITDKGGTVATGTPPTFAQLVTGIGTIPAISSYPVVLPVDTEEKTTTTFRAYAQGGYVNSPTSGSKTTVLGFKWAGANGQIRIITGMWCQYAYPCYSQIFINGVAVGIERMNNTTSTIEWSQDFNIKTGDLIEIRAQKNYDSIVYIVNTRILIGRFDIGTRTVG
ncbi:hypothetical protein phiG2_25 [Lysinibacillus phage phiG2]|nr:hypothetical protein phiG2_25 [Lysinibacillus phage phiG2]